MISKIMQEYMAYSYQPNFWTKLKKWFHQIIFHNQVYMISNKLPKFYLFKLKFYQI